jgi:hypothetical protein
MPEILGNAGLYFDPERPTDIANSLYILLQEIGHSERRRPRWLLREQEIFPGNGAPLKPFPSSRNVAWVRCLEGQKVSTIVF